MSASMFMCVFMNGISCPCPLTISPSIPLSFPFLPSLPSFPLPSSPQVFRDPEALIVKEGARVMSLLDGTSKMSKSAENDGSRINLLDSPETIRNKIKRCKTDMSVGLEWDNPARPECTNLLNIYLAVSENEGKTKESIMKEVEGMNWGAFKPLLADAVVAHLEPIQKRYREVMEDPVDIEEILTTGAADADAIASQTLQWAKDAMGFYSLGRK